MNEKLQRIYYVIGIVQRILMIVMTFLMMGVAYKIYDFILKFGVEIKDIHNLVTSIKTMLERSWLF